MNIRSIIYWIATVAFCGIMLYSAQMYLTKTEMVKGFYEHLGYPTYLVIPLAIAKILGVIMVFWRKSQWLTEWAYAGFFFDITLAFFAHQVLDESVTFTLTAMVFLLLSYFFGKEVRNT